jgi:CheY-like chemotaxis protein
MNSVIGFTSLLRTSELTEEQEHYVKMIETSGEGLLEIINDVLDISKIEAGRMELSLEAVDATVLAHEVAAMMTSRADEKGVMLEVRILTAIPDEVSTDRARLRQILINLVGNALKFTAKGSVTLEMSYGPGNELHFKVIDTGIGIPEESMERLFKPFSQADSSTTRDFGGTGLGLAICKRLCEAMGGGISVMSHSGQGSCFAFHVDAPRAESPIAALAEAEASPAVAAKDPADNPAILVVDDNPINRKVLGSILQVSGYERVEYAFDGAQAVAAARQNMPDIVFMDVEMPVMDGMTATTEIRRLTATTAQRPWIIGLSANVWPDTVRRSAEVGMNNYLVKPVRRSDVEAAIGERL